MKTVYKLWALSIQPKIPNISKRAQMVLLGKFPENPEIQQFPESEPFNRKFRKLWEESQMERKFPVRNFRKFRLLSSYPEIPKNAVPFIEREAPSITTMRLSDLILRTDTNLP